MKGLTKLNDIEIAKNILIKNNYSCVIVTNKSTVFTSHDRGVKPLIDFYRTLTKTELTNYTLADKIIGKASVLLAILCNINEIYTPIISKLALKVCEDNNIKIHYDTIVKRIQNRTKDGFCPMETLALETDDPLELYERVLDFHAGLSGK